MTLQLVAVALFANGDKSDEEEGVVAQKDEEEEEWGKQRNREGTRPFTHVVEISA